MNSRPRTTLKWKTPAEALDDQLASLQQAGVASTAESGQYTSIDFGRTLRTSGVVASMGSIGDAFDNAMAESFFATLKEEMIYRRWPSRHELEMEVFSFIEGFYNPLRRHSRLGNLSPAAYEQQFTTQTEVSG